MSEYHGEHTKGCRCESCVEELSPDTLAATRIAQLEWELAEAGEQRDKLSGILRDSLEAMAEFERLALMRNRYREPLSVALHIRVMIDKIVKALKSTSSSLWRERDTLRERDKRSRELLRIQDKLIQEQRGVDLMTSDSWEEYAQVQAEIQHFLAGGSQ